ncbi:4-hydroxy-3-methylbut-2-enyl diphosphate reductase [Lyticum sinuosum]|uniref:4-hydroxy-3-methylbut-2-enyl diphosphate reductase n=1 Tax=Lyticum sinuosum TaxID=1332059 RepID=A0AAE4VKQ5_9RICK|nr:4-hydroxy-3-methylbut-2-enyl diphosphate reductase [Lyticum sinuosum]MDZ5761198.1 4-hydroxy-3-methylbut-2-enyl diphosphate reductase [Lyticum sinuosum]
MEIIIAQPRGFCAGVIRAIETVDEALEIFHETIYVYHEIVHNKRVVNDFIKKGVVFVDNINLIPKGSIVILSAHGVAKKIERLAKNLELRIIDATCPLVKKVHHQIVRYESYNTESSRLINENYSKNDKIRQIIIIGHHNHPEVIGIIGQTNQKVIVIEKIEDVDLLDLDTNQPISYVTQTTLSIDDTSAIINKLKSKFLDISGPDLTDICYATQNRQEAVKTLLKIVDMIIVVGSTNSSNSNRLYEIARNYGTPSYLIDDINQIQIEWFEGIGKIGITAGASAPEILFQEIMKKIISFFPQSKIIDLPGKKEFIDFKLPKMTNL